MISEEQQNQAALHALGLLDADEAAAFEQAQAANDELRALADDFRDAAASLVSDRAVPPPAGLKERVLASVAAEAGRAEAGKVIAMPSRRGSWVPWALAAVLAASCVALGALSWDLFQKESRSAREAKHAKGRAKAAEATLAAERSNALARVSYCALESVPTSHATGPQAAVLWDAASRHGRLQIQKLPPPGNGKDYQLWAVEAGHKNPISAGVVTVNADGGATVDFQPGAGDDANAAVAAFALSVERAGGVANNEGPILFLGKLGP